MKKGQILITEGKNYYRVDEIYSDSIDATFVLNNKNEKMYYPSGIFLTKYFSVPTEQEIHKFKLFMSGNGL